MIRGRAETSGTAGTLGGKTLADIIERTKRGQERDDWAQKQAQEGAQKAPGAPQSPWEGLSSQESYWRGYQDGIIDAGKA